MITGDLIRVSHLPPTPWPIEHQALHQRLERDLTAMIRNQYYTGFSYPIGNGDRTPLTGQSTRLLIRLDLADDQPLERLLELIRIALCQTTHPTPGSYRMISAARKVEVSTEIGNKITQFIEVIITWYEYSPSEVAA